MRLRRASAIVAIVMSMLAAGCATTDSAPSGPIVTVFGGYRGVEAQRFAASLVPFEKETGIDVRYVGTGSFAKSIEARVANADYPDVAIFPQPGIIRQLAAQGILEPLDDDTRATVLQDPDTALPGFNDELYGVWYRSSVKSLVWYEPQVFAERGYRVPTTWSELMDLTEEMKSDGYAPWCVAIESFGATGWVATDWIEDIVLRQSGPDVYDAWVDGEVTFEDEPILDAFDTFGEIVRTPGNVYGGTQRILGTPWTEAQDPMFEDPPRCLLNRQGSVQQAHLPGSVSVGNGTDVFVLPPMQGDEAPILAAGEFAAAFNDRPEVRALLRYLATPESGIAWAELGGFVSPHKSFDTSLYGDELDRRMGETIAEADVVRFDASDQMVPSVGSGTFWSAMVSFIQSGDAHAAAAEAQAGYPQATQLPTVPTPGN